MCVLRQAGMWMRYDLSVSILWIVSPFPCSAISCTSTPPPSLLALVSHAGTSRAMALPLLQPLPGATALPRAAAPAPRSPRISSKDLRFQSPGAHCPSDARRPGPQSRSQLRAQCSHHHRLPNAPTTGLLYWQVSTRWDPEGKVTSPQCHCSTLLSTSALTLRPWVAHPPPSPGPSTLSSTLSSALSSALCRPRLGCVLLSVDMRAVQSPVLGTGGLHKAKGLFPSVSDFFLAAPQTKPPPPMRSHFTFSLQGAERWPPKTCLPSSITIPGTWDVMLFGDSVFEDITEDLT